MDVMPSHNEIYQAWVRAQGECVARMLKQWRFEWGPPQMVFDKQGMLLGLAQLNPEPDQHVRIMISARGDG